MNVKRCVPSAEACNVRSSVICEQSERARNHTELIQILNYLKTYKLTINHAVFVRQFRDNQMENYQSEY